MKQILFVCAVCALFAACVVRERPVERTEVRVVPERRSEVIIEKEHHHHHHHPKEEVKVEVR